VIARLHTPAPVSSAARHFGWYELITTNMEGAKAFYEAVLGWSTQDGSPDSAYAIFTAAGASVAGLLSLPEEAVKSGFRPTWLGYVTVADVDAAAARVAQLGGAVHVPPKDVPGISRISIAVDREMATIGLLKWCDHRPDALPNLDATGHVGWHELLALDCDKAFDFYRSLFGWRKAQADSGPMGTYQLFEAGELTIGGIFTKPPEVPLPFWLYYFNVADIDLALQRVKGAHGRIVEGPIEIPGSRWIVRCTDPQGAVFALLGNRRHDGIGYFERAPSRSS
jgi:predicted enzyme related to lactoylglutathione lyase